MDVELDGVTKVYDDAQGTETAVDDVSLHVEDGELAVIIGPSGCGKSTTLRLIAGLETVTDGTIRMGDREVQHLAPSERSVAMAFQNFALYRQMSVARNLEYGLKHSTNLSRAERRERVETIAEMLEIEDLLDASPNELSGGQKQRVALGRAIVREPDVFLLDEPLSNLDAKLRATLRTELQRIQDEFGVTTIHVTHDQKEAMGLADRLAIMYDGKLQQIADPEEAYHHPANRFVATFLGSPAMNVLTATARREDDALAFAYDGADLARVPVDSVATADVDRVDLGFRPNDVSLHENPAEGTFTAEVLVNEYQGNERYLYLSIGDAEIIVRASPETEAAPGDGIGITVPPENVYLFDSDTGNAIKTKGVAGPTEDVTRDQSVAD